MTTGADVTTPSSGYLAGYSRFDEIPTADLAALLSSQTIGRIGWQAPDGPVILPVSYAAHRNAIVFRTSPYGVLSDLVRPQPVAFQIDDLDQVTETGWSVLVRGRSVGVADPGEIAELWEQQGLRPWASGVRNLFIKISVDRMSGRIVTR